MSGTCHLKNIAIQYEKQKDVAYQILFVGHAVH